jgi:DNA-binding response OmpR family regulator
MPRHRVLVVDDEPHISRIIRTRLEQGPFAVTVVESGSDALRAIDEDPSVRLLILDLMLPGMSGLDVLRAVRQDARWRDLPCIVLTAAGQDVHFRTAHELGASEFMTKPFSPRRLLARALFLVGLDENSSADPVDNQ